MREKEKKRLKCNDWRKKKNPDGDEKASTVEEEKAEVRKDILFNNDAVLE